jgi:hypothetical protein
MFTQGAACGAKRACVVQPDDPDPRRRFRDDNWKHVRGMTRICMMEAEFNPGFLADWL